MEKEYITRLRFGNNPLKHFIATKIFPVKRVAIRYKNKGATNAYIMLIAKIGKSGIDFRHRVCYNKRKANKCFFERVVILLL